MIKTQLRYLVLPQYVYADTKLTLASLKVYAFIHSYTNPFYFGNEHLAEMFGVHLQTISTAIKQLEELGYIKIIYKVRAEGGKTRLCVDTHSDSVSTLIRDGENHAPTQSTHSDKDNNIKDNNIKGTASLFVDKFNLLLKRNFRVTDKVQTMLKARLKNFTLEEVILALEKMAADPFNQGQNDRGWSADPAYLLRNDSQIDKFLNKKSLPKKQEYRKFDDVEQLIAQKKI